MQSENKKALSVGVLCISTYLVNYYLRNILSVLTPGMLETGLFTKSGVGVLSSVYMIFYAGGQLVNGFLGDRLSPKKLACAGICLAGLSSVVFPFVPWQLLQIVCFGVLGFGLSMVRGPLMKIISENTKPNHARTICVFFSFASFAGPLIASLFAMAFAWKWAFVAAGALAFAAAVLVYLVLSVMECRGGIAYQSTKGQGLGSLLAVFKIEKFLFYMVIACLVEIAGTTVSFWIPTYLTDALGFEKNTANLIYSGISTARSFMPFVALIIFRAVRERDIPMMRVSFLLAVAGFLCMAFVQAKWVSIAFLLVALMAMSCTSALLWSIYIPGLGKTGKVSSINGVLDCTGYVAAAGANLLFSGTMEAIGWNGIILLWSAMGLIGLAATFFVKMKTAE